MLIKGDTLPQSGQPCKRYLFGLQSDRILPLDIAHIEQLLQDVTDYLQEIRPMRPNVPQGVKALPVTMTIPAGTIPVL